MNTDKRTYATQLISEHRYFESQDGTPYTFSEDGVTYPEGSEVGMTKADLFHDRLNRDLTERGFETLTADEWIELSRECAATAIRASEAAFFCSENAIHERERVEPSIR
jgi:hypothetical protein